MSFSPLRLDGGGLMQVLDVLVSGTPAMIAGSDTQGFYLTSSTPLLGNAWTVQNRGIGAKDKYRQVAAVKWSVRETNTIYALTGDFGNNGGLIVSTDGGASWHLRSNVPQGSGNGTQAPLPSTHRSTGRLIVQDPGSDWLFVGTYKAGVVRSANNGNDNFPVSATMAGAAPGTAKWFCRSLVQQPGTPSNMYAAFYDSTGVTGAVWQCQGTGANGPHGTTPDFTKMAGSPPTPEGLLCLANGDLFAACGSNGIWFLRGGQTTWHNITGTLDLTSSYWCTIDGYTDGSGNDVVFASCSTPATGAAGVVKGTVLSTYTSGSITWANQVGTVQTATIPPTNYTWWKAGTGDLLGKGNWVNPFIILDPNDATHQKIYICGSQGMYRSVDGGATWTVANSGCPQFLAHPVEADPNHAGHVVFGDSDYGAWDDTTPGTENATTLNDDPPVKDVAQNKGVQAVSFAFDPVDSTVYCGIGRKYSNAIGEIYARTWNDTAGIGGWDGGGFTGLSQGAMGFGASTVAGGAVAIGLCALRDAGNNKILLAAAWGAGLWRWAPTGSGGAYQWTQVSSVISAATQPGNFLRIAHVAGSAFVYCFDKKKGIYRSSDYGQTWTATPIVTLTSGTSTSGDLAVHPTTAGELWVTSGGTLYKVVGAQTGTGITPTAITAVSNASPVAVAPAGTVSATAAAILVATADTGSGSGLLVSLNDGSTFADGVGDASFSRCNSAPEHIAVGPDGRIYVSGSNVVATGFMAGGGVTGTSAAFTLVQKGTNIAAAGGTGLLPLFFNQTGGGGSLVGSAVFARIELNDCTVTTTVTAPNPNWLLVKDSPAGTANGQARVQIWAWLNNPGGLGAPPAVIGGMRAVRRRTGRRGLVVTTAAPSGSVSPGNPQVFTCSNASATIKGVLSEWSTPAGTVQFVDQSGAAGAVASATSLPVSCSAAQSYSGGLGLAEFGAFLTGGTTGQSWTAPNGWTSDNVANNSANVFNDDSLAATVAGTTTVTGTITLGTWTMTSWAGVVATFYAVAGAPLSITTGSLPNGTVGAGYSAALSAGGGAPPYSWAVTAGAVPTGLALSAAGVLSGTPTAAGSFTFTVTVTDSSNQTVSAAFTVTIAAAAQLTITTLVLPGATAGVAYAATLAAVNGVPPYTWTVTAGTLPPGLVLASTGSLSGIPAVTGTYQFTVTVTDAAAGMASVVLAIAVSPVASTVDSLVINDQVELLGGPGGVASADPLCAGVIFRLQPGFDLGEPQPTTDIVGSLILDGERPFGYRASNRTITLPIVVDASTAPGGFAALDGAYELLLRAVDQQFWPLTWTRRGGLPLVLDCFRAQPTVVSWGGVDEVLGQPIGAVQLTFQALPYGRSDIPVPVALPSPLPGQLPPPPPIVLDSFANVAGAQWIQSARVVIGPNSAAWNPCLPPLSDCTGAGSQPGAFYQAQLAAPVSIVGLTALSVYVGLGSAYFSTWHRGPAVFIFTLSDNDGVTLSFSRTLRVEASDDPGAPNWQLVTASIPQGAPGFDYTNVASYSVTVTNRGFHTLRYTNLYLDHLVANPPALQQGVPAIRGAMYQLFGVVGTARTTCAIQCQQAPGTSPPVTVILPGPPGVPLTWNCPPGVTSVQVENTGPGGSSALGAGGGGEYSQEPAVGVTPLGQPLPGGTGTGTGVYTYVLGAPGTPGANGTDARPGIATVFTGDPGPANAVVTANPGAPGKANGQAGQGGSGSSNTIHNMGGAGAAGINKTSGGGGGGAAGSGGQGGNGVGTAAGLGAGGVTPGGNGGKGATSDRDGYPGLSPGGGAGGAFDNIDNAGQLGGAGQIKLTYTPAVAPYSTLLVHRAGPAAPPQLSPLVSFGPGDVPNGLTEYPVQSLVPSIYANFAGTYTVVVTAASWDNPAASRTVTVTVKQYEFAGGPAYTTAVSRTFTPATATFVPNGGTLAQVPIVVLGELTLPLKDDAPDNASGLFTITLTDTDTADQFLDAMFLDTLGEAVIIGVPTAGSYANFYIDEPTPDRALGRVLGSAFGRPEAISVLDNAIVSGGPPYLEPGDNMLLVYALEGAPALSVIYFPRWFLGRLA